MKIKISAIKANKNNPRQIKDEKFKRLVESIREFPEMLEKRPLVCFTDVDGKYVVLGGNMRLKAAIEVGLKEIPILLADDWTEEQRDEFLIKDNVSFGEWNYDNLANNWDESKLKVWGVDVWQEETFKYEPNVTPESNYDDITKEQILAKAKELANQMMSAQKLVDVICPECGNEFNIQN